MSACPRPRPSLRLLDVLTTLLVFLAAVLAIGLRLPAPLQFVQDQDWSHQLAGANQILRGFQPFVDFLAVYGPLTFYSSALFQYLSGTRIIGELALVLLGYSISYTILCWVLRSITNNRLWAFVFSVILVFLVPRLYKYYIVLGPALTLLFLWRYIDRPSYKRLWMTALAVVVTGLYRADFGGYMAICSSVGILTVPSRTLRSRIWDVLHFGGAAVIIASPWLIFLLTRGALGSYLYASTIASSETAAGMSTGFSFSQNSPGLANLQTSAALVFLLTPATAFLLLLRQRHLMEQTQWSKVVALTAASQLSMIQALHRSDFAHLLQALPLTIVLLAWLLIQEPGHWRSIHGMPTLAGRILLVASLGAVLFMALPPWKDVSIRNSVARSKMYSLQRNEFMDALIARYRNNAALEAMNYVRSCSDPSVEILAWPYLLNFYYFTDRPFGSLVMALSPGYFTSDEYQRLIVQDLQARQAPLFIFQPLKFTARTENMEDYTPVVAEYLKATYVPERKFSNITIYVNRHSATGLRCRGLQD